MGRERERERARGRKRKRVVKDLAGLRAIEIRHRDIDINL